VEKLYCCTNKNCPSRTPNTPDANEIVVRITSEHKLSPAGEPVGEPTIVREEYYCSRCNSEAREISGEEIMKVEFTQSTSGKFYNWLRDPRRGFKFKISDGRITFARKDDMFREVEREFIWSKLEEKIDELISVEILNTGVNQFDSPYPVFELDLKNDFDGVRINIFMDTRGNLLEWYGDRKPNKKEYNKAFMKVQDGQYLI